MKVLSFFRLSLIVGLTLGMMVLWASAAPSMMEGSTLQGGSWSFCNCIRRYVDCEDLDSRCTINGVYQCREGSSSNNLCDYDGDGNCGGLHCPDDIKATKKEKCLQSIISIAECRLGLGTRLYFSTVMFCNTIFHLLVFCACFFDNADVIIQIIKSYPGLPGFRSFAFFILIFEFGCGQRPRQEICGKFLNFIKNSIDRQCSAEYDEYQTIYVNG